MGGSTIHMRRKQKVKSILACMRSRRKRETVSRHDEDMQLLVHVCQR